MVKTPTWVAVPWACATPGTKAPRAIAPERRPMRRKLLFTTPQPFWFVADHIRPVALARSIACETGSRADDAGRAAFAPDQNRSRGQDAYWLFGCAASSDARSLDSLALSV